MSQKAINIKACYFKPFHEDIFLFINTFDCLTSGASSKILKRSSRCQSFTGKSPYLLFQKRCWSSHACKRKTSRILTSPCKFTTIYGITNSNTFLNLKDRTKKEFQSSVINKFICPGWKASYLEKTDRWCCLATRLQEHTHSENSEIHKHINACSLR